MLSGDIYYLDYRNFKVHFPAHRFVMLGFDDERDEVYVADRTEAETQTCSTRAIRLSRNPPEGITTHNLWGKFHSGAGSVRSAGSLWPRPAQDCATHARYRHLTIRADAGCTGRSRRCPGGRLEGLRTFAEHLHQWPGRDGAARHAGYVDNAIVKFGTGGGFFRDHFHRFMCWAQEQRPDLVTSSTVDLARQAAAAWNALSPTMRGLAENPDDQSAWRQADHQVQEIYELEYALFGHLADRVLAGGPAEAERSGSAQEGLVMASR